MRYAVLGGSFDPVHKGHLKLAEAVLPLGYDRIIFVPTYHSPFKSSSQGISALSRLRMLLAAICADRRFMVDACEIKREGVSYTIATLDDITGRYLPCGKPGLILGDDVAEDFPTWKNADEIAAKVDIIIANRIHSVPRNFPFPCKFLDNAIMKVSSGSVRDMIAEGGNWQDLVGEGVADIIIDEGLYGVRANAAVPAKIMHENRRETIFEIEREVRTMINPYRFIHSRNVALHCSDLCKRFSVNPDSGYLAGITHDMCKDLSEDEMTALARKDGSPFSEEEQKKPSLLHGRAAAILLRERFSITDESVIDAVRYHTTGKIGMNALSKIVYLTDKIEVARTTVATDLRRAAFTKEGEGLELDALFNIVFRATVAWLLERALKVSDDSLRLLETIGDTE